ncbi:hypothetical protein EIP86_002994 [Pleurotus ostreatoroseus]|nr:hypothetical protein EIP86_002994 [Pleurotus ostreatoroseus]
MFNGVSDSREGITNYKSSRPTIDPQFIRHIFSGAALPDTFADVVTSFKKAFAADIKSDSIEYALSTDSVQDYQGSKAQKTDILLSPELSTLIAEKIATIQAQRAHHPFIRRADRLGMIRVMDSVYKPVDVSPRDSNVAFRTTQRCGWRLGRVFQILKRTRRDPANDKRTEDIFIEIEEYTPLDDNERGLDPYRKFPLSGKLFRKDILSQHVIITPDEIWCHCAISSPVLSSPPGGATYIHAMPTDKYKTKAGRKTFWEWILLRALVGVQRQGVVIHNTD